MFSALLRTNISLPKKGTLEDDVPLPQVGYPSMLVPWRVYLCFFTPEKHLHFDFNSPGRVTTCQAVRGDMGQIPKIGVGW